MVNHHPDQFLLTDYAAGSVEPALALPISVHLNYCAQCRSEARELNHLGAQLFTESDPIPVADDALSTIMAVIDCDHESSRNSDQAAEINLRQQDQEGELPPHLNQLVPNGLDQLKWKNMTRSLSVSRLKFGDSTHEVSLHHIKAGSNVPEHTHRGNEATVVLKGSFSDQDGVYQPGDFILRTPADQHSPVASEYEDCLCLSVQDAPIKFVGTFSRLLNPLMRLHPH